MLCLKYISAQAQALAGQKEALQDCSFPAALPCRFLPLAPRLNLALGD